jgi:hypothetical protein
MGGVRPAVCAGGLARRPFGVGVGIAIGIDLGRAVGVESDRVAGGGCVADRVAGAEVRRQEVRRQEVS